MYVYGRLGWYGIFVVNVTVIVLHGYSQYFLVKKGLLNFYLT